MLGSLDPAKVLVILVIALVVLGPERLPRAARQLGTAWRELTRLRDQVTEEVRAAIPDVDVPRIAPGAVSGFLRDLTSSHGSEITAGASSGETGDGELVSTEALAHGAASTELFRHGPLPTGRPPAGAPDAPGRSIGAPAAVPSPAPDDPGMN